MAHEYVMNYMASPDCKDTTVSNIVSIAWSYADLMQDEADKRRKKPYDFVPAIMKGIRNAELEEWQPDWSQAPDNADSWTKISDSEAVWWVGYPYFNGERFTDALGESYTCGYAPLFDYNGNWQDSLRKRPQ